MIYYFIKRCSWQALLLLPGIIIMLESCSDRQQTLLFVGNSMTAGDAVDPKDKYPALIERQLPDYNIVTQERATWASSDYLQNWEEVVDDFPSRADFVFIQLGANELRKYGHSDTTISNCIENIKMIAERIKIYFPKAEIVLMSNLKIDYSAIDQHTEMSGFSELTNFYLSSIGEGYSMISYDNKYNFIDLHRQVPIKSTHDGVNLDNNGHSIVANIILGFLRKYQQANQGKNLK
jgi:lysophospholipase L1-like esterase